MEAVIRTTLKIDGMACGMCESHINDTVRRAFPVKKAASSRKKGVTEIISDAPLDEAALRAAIDAAGYRVLEISTEFYEKKGLFGK